ncbi:MAG: DinB family protein [Bacteroidia bacterium]
MEEKIKLTLAELALVLQELKPETYTQNCQILSNGTIGQHCRHIIEFFFCLFEGYEEGMISYDRRKRDLQLECQVQFAIQKISEIISVLSRKDKKLISSYLIDEEEILVETSYKRELAFNLEHCIHHQALIRIAIENLSEIRLNDHFGVSASTVYYRQQLCAPSA